MNQGMKKIQKGNVPAIYSVFQAQREIETQKAAKDKDTLVRKSQIQESLVIFQPAYYPFMNSESRTSNIFRTTVKVNILPHEIKRIIQLNHANLINIQKITRSRPKASCESYDSKTMLSFYYQEVQYSLKTVATSQKGTTYLLKRLANISIHKLLTDLSQYLNLVGVSYLFDVADIGVNSKEQIKVYISPDCFFSPSKKFTIQEISRSIEKISAWWQTTVNSHEAINPKTSNIIITNEIELEDQSLIDSVSKINNSYFIQKQANRLLGFDQDDNQQQKPHKTKQTITKTNHLKDSNHSIESQCSIITSMQLEKVKKINRQIKCIRDRLNSKKKSEEESKQFAIKQKNLRVKTTSDIQHFDKVDYRDGGKNSNQNSNVIQKIQQNINCINIYTNSKQSPKKNKIMKMTSQPIYSYKISPQIPRIQQKINPVIVHHPSFQPEDFPNSEQDSSVDTYEMDLEAQIQPAKQVQKNKQFTPVQRQISQKNYRTSHEDRNNSSKKTQNQVANKNVTGSAGPLQFKNFVNNFIKPQFLAKKSNIYEDPMEYDSQTSKSISKKKKNAITDLYQNGRSVNSHTQKSSSLNNNNSTGNQPNCKKKQQYLVVENAKIAASPRNNIMSRTNSEIKLIQIQDFSGEKKMQQLMRKSKKGVTDSKIGQRVKTVLEKTKNAIALLNKVKACKSPSYKQSPSQSLQYYY